VREWIKEGRGVLTTRGIHIPVDQQATYELLVSKLKSLENAGYTDIGFTADWK
jgi:hypothetical protein